MIDVMFFLLVTFMLASLSMKDLHSLQVHLPKGHAAPMPETRHVITLTVTQEGQLLLDRTHVTMDTLTATLRPMLKGTNGSIIVNADASASHGVVTEAMLRARDAGVQKFLIAVKHAS